MKKIIAGIMMSLLVAITAFAQDASTTNDKTKKGAAIGGIAGAIVGAVIGNNRGHHSSKRGAIIQTISAFGFCMCIADRTVAINGEVDDRRHVVAGLRTEPMAADQSLHIFYVNRVWKIAAFELRHAGAADWNLRRGRLHRGGG